MGEADEGRRLGGRPVDAVLAGLHLRSGLHALARAELESLAGEDALDEQALLDLAEVRWRTGDLAGAGEAADAFLEAGGDATLGWAIAAEARAALGRPAEARRLAGQAIERSHAPLDRVFAGMPRSSIWPADPAGDPLLPKALVDGPGPGSSRGRTRRPASAVVSGRPARAAATAAAASGGRASSPPGAAAGPVEAGGWLEPPAVEPARSHRPRPAEPDPHDELAAARTAIGEGRLGTGAIHLAVALRLAPALAPAVLDAARDLADPALDIVRGDAYRLVGQELEARRAWAAASEAMALAEPPAEPLTESPAERPAEPLTESPAERPGGHPAPHTVTDRSKETQ